MSTSKIQQEQTDKVTRNDLEKVVEKLINGKDTYGVRHIIYYDTESGEFLERYPLLRSSLYSMHYKDQKERLQDSADAAVKSMIHGQDLDKRDGCIIIYKSPEHRGTNYVHGRYTEDAFVHALFSKAEWAVYALNNLREDEEISKPTYDMLLKSQWQMVSTWLMLHKREYVKQLVDIEKEKEKALAELVERALNKLNDAGYA